MKLRLSILLLQPHTIEIFFNGKLNIETYFYALKKLFCFFLMVIHFNAAMFFPQAKEHDMFDSNGRQVDEINSVAEFLLHSAFNIIPSIPLDEDGDEQNFFNTNNSSNYTTVNFFDFYLLPVGERISSKIDFYNYYLPFTVEELCSPPPEIV